jgi:hypothetical protein
MGWHGYDAIAPIDTMSASDPFGEFATAWVFANGPPNVSRHVTLTRSDMIAHLIKNSSLYTSQHERRPMCHGQAWLGHKRLS